MLYGTYRILKSFPFSLSPAKQQAYSLGRSLRGKRKVIQNIPTKVLSVSKTNELVRKRLETFWYENQTSASEMDLDSLSANKYLEYIFILLPF